MYSTSLRSYPNHVVNAVIHAITRFDDGDVHSITATSQDETIEIRHSVDLKAPALTETSMKPFLDNSHVDKTHKLRVQFQGAHNLKITKLDKISRFQCPPIYKFHNQRGNTCLLNAWSSILANISTDFLEFQGLLLNKEVKHTFDVKSIKSTTDDEAQCRQGTIRILLDPFSRSRSILYFRHTSDQKHGFVEWPGTLRNISSSTRYLPFSLPVLASPYQTLKVFHLLTNPSAPSQRPQAPHQEIQNPDSRERGWQGALRIQRLAFATEHEGQRGDNQLP